MELYKAPQKYPDDDKYTIFLGGSIEMGKAEEWQQRISIALSDKNIRILNPRRDDFDSSQQQSINNPYFKEQVNWELDSLDRADLIIMYLQKDTLSPISMMEIGLYAKTKKMLICCPDGFWRKGNIEIVADRYAENCTLFDTYQDLERYLVSTI